LLPWNTCLIGLDGDGAYFGICCFHDLQPKLFLDNFKVEML
jgi:hypothetical protein